MLTIKKVRASRPCRIRLYQSRDHLIKDIARPAEVLPTRGNHGVLMDLVLSDAAVMNGDWILSPCVGIAVDYDTISMLVEPPAMVKFTFSLPG